MGDSVVEVMKVGDDVMTAGKDGDVVLGVEKVGDEVVDVGDEVGGCIVGGDNGTRNCEDEWFATEGSAVGYSVTSASDGATKGDAVSTSVLMEGSPVVIIFVETMFGAGAPTDGMFVGLAVGPSSVASGSVTVGTESVTVVGGKSLLSFVQEQPQSHDTSSQSIVRVCKLPL